MSSELEHNGKEKSKRGSEIWGDICNVKKTILNCKKLRHLETGSRRGKDGLLQLFMSMTDITKDLEKLRW